MMIIDREIIDRLNVEHLRFKEQYDRIMDLPTKDNLFGSEDRTLEMIHNKIRLLENSNERRIQLITEREQIKTEVKQYNTEYDRFHLEIMRNLTEHIIDEPASRINLRRINSTGG